MLLRYLQMSFRFILRGVQESSVPSDAKYRAWVVEAVMIAAGDLGGNLNFRSVTVSKF